MENPLKCSYDNSGSETSSPFETFSNTGGIKNFNPPGSANGATASAGNDWVLVLDDVSKGYAIPGTVAPIPGAGFNSDTKVDGADLTIWEANFGTGTSQAQGDADLDADVDGVDFLAWQRGFTGNPQQQEELILEGESATPAAGSSFTVGSDSNASGNQYLFATAANRTTPDLSDYAELTFNVTTAGTYRLLGSVLSPSSSQNSFWVQVDDGPIWKWHTPSDNPTLYLNVYVTDEGTANPPEKLVLSAGTRTIRLYSRDPNTRLDTMELELVSANGGFDNDGDVDGADFLAWQRGSIDLEELTQWQDNYGFSGSNSIAASVSQSTVAAAPAQNLSVQAVSQEVAVPPPVATPLFSQQLVTAAIAGAWQLNSLRSAAAVSSGPLRKEGQRDSVAVAFDHFIPLFPSSHTGRLAKKYYLERNSASSRIHVPDSLPRFDLESSQVYSEVVDRSLDNLFGEGRATDREWSILFLRECPYNIRS